MENNTNESEAANPILILVKTLGEKAYYIIQLSYVNLFLAVNALDLTGGHQRASRNKNSSYGNIYNIHIVLVSYRGGWFQGDPLNKMYRNR